MASRDRATQSGPVAGRQSRLGRATEPDAERRRPEHGGWVTRLRGEYQRVREHRLWAQRAAVQYQGFQNTACGSHALFSNTTLQHQHQQLATQEQGVTRQAQQLAILEAQNAALMARLAQVEAAIAQVVSRAGR
jgi:hypothetical protein